MIDTHSHIVFGIDDGSRSLEESLEMLKKAKEVGYEKIYCTSHYKVGKWENKNYYKNLKNLKKVIEEKKITVELIEANELMLDLDGLKALEEEKVNTIGLSNYLLVEPIPGMTGMNLIKALKRIIDLGYRPILAHTERYIHLNLETMDSIKELGVLFQINLSSIKSTMAKRVKNLYKRGYIDLVGSDAHRTDRRTYNLEEYIKLWKELVGEDFKRYSEVNPQIILENKEVALKIKKNRESINWNKNISNFIASFCRGFR